METQQTMHVCIVRTTCADGDVSSTAFLSRDHVLQESVLGMCKENNTHLSLTVYDVDPYVIDANTQRGRGPGALQGMITTKTTLKSPCTTHKQWSASLKPPTRLNVQNFLPFLFFFFLYLFICLFFSSRNRHKIHKKGVGRHNLYCNVQHRSKQ